MIYKNVNSLESWKEVKETKGWILRIFNSEAKAYKILGDVIIENLDNTGGLPIICWRCMILPYNFKIFRHNINDFFFNNPRSWGWWSSEPTSVNNEQVSPNKALSEEHLKLTKIELYLLWTQQHVVNKWPHKT